MKKDDNPAKQLITRSNSFLLFACFGLLLSAGSSVHTRVFLVPGSLDASMLFGSVLERT